MKNSKQDENINFLKFIVIFLFALFILIDIGIYRVTIGIFHYGILLIMFLTMGTIWIKIGPDGIKFGSSDAKEKRSNTTIKYYDNRKIYYPMDTTSSFPDHDDSDIYNKIIKNT